MDITFERAWIEKGRGYRFTFETAETLSFSNLLDDIEASSFRLDINDDVNHEIYVIGDSHDGGFLVSEDVTDAVQALLGLSIVSLIQMASLAPDVFDAQSEFDAWLLEYEAE